MSTVWGSGTCHSLKKRSTSTVCESGTCHALKIKFRTGSRWGTYQRSCHSRAKDPVQRLYHTAGNALDLKSYLRIYDIPYPLHTPANGDGRVLRSHCVSLTHKHLVQGGMGTYWHVLRTLCLDLVDDTFNRTVHPSSQTRRCYPCLHPQPPEPYEQALRDKASKKRPKKSSGERRLSYSLRSLRRKTGFPSLYSPRSTVANTFASSR